VRADVASRSLEEVWLEPRPSEQAPGAAEAPKEGTRRRVLSTLIKRRSADTLAGETISTLSGQRRVATRVLGWGAAAAGILALGWSVLAQAPSAQIAHAASAVERGASLAEPTSERQPATAPAPVGEPIATAMLTANDPRAAKKSTLPSSEMRAALNAGAANLDATKQGAMQHAKPVDTAKARRAAARPVSTAKQPQGRKRIDQEFGF
jgi:hypothetical protein